MDDKQNIIQLFNLLNKKELILKLIIYILMVELIL